MQQQIRKQAQAKTEQQITQQWTPKHSRKPKKYNNKSEKATILYIRKTKNTTINSDTTLWKTKQNSTFRNTTAI